MAVITQIISKPAHNPPVPVFNKLIGAGKCNMRINYAMPIRDWTTFFRSQVWGYFFILMIVIWCLIGFPSYLAEYTGLSRTTTNRSMPPSGLKSIGVFE